MAYTELIKNLDTIRSYIRSFYVYGFKARNTFVQKSARTYDDEKRRLENYLSGYMHFRTEDGGKISFVSIDSRKTSHNPLYALFKAKSFTAMDISLHFMLLDMLWSPSVKKSLATLLDEITSVYLAGFSANMLPEESTVRKKLKEYVSLGLIHAEKNGNTVLYHRATTPAVSPFSDALSFFSEIAPCGVVGSFLLDTLDDETQQTSDVFQFKHHSITASIESDFVCTVLTAIREQRFLHILQQKNGKTNRFSVEIVPLVIYQSTQSGRLYLMAYQRRNKYFMPLRFDYIASVQLGEVYEGYAQKRAAFEELRKHIWGVALKQNKKHNDTTTVHITFTVHFAPNEQFIYQRLLREKRGGTVCRIDEQTARFSADIFDPQEIVPWVRTFICRITEFSCSDRAVTRQFYKDIRAMQALYADVGDNHAV